MWSEKNQLASAAWKLTGEDSGVGRGGTGGTCPPNFQSDKKKCPFYKESALFSCLTLVCLSERYEIVPK